MGMENGPVGERGGELLTLGLELCGVPLFLLILLPLRGWSVCTASDRVLRGCLGGELTGGGGEGGAGWVRSRNRCS